MPTIPLDFSNVESYDNLPLGKYFGSIDKIELRPAASADKFDQLMAVFLVIDGELTGRKSTEFLSLSPKAAFRLKKWFDMFGLADEMTGLDIDDDTNQLTDPDLVGINVIFEVYEDPKLYQGEKQIRTRLTEVLEDEPAPAPPPRAAARRPVAAAPAPADDTEDEDPPEDEPAPVAAAPARRPLPARPAATSPARRTLR